MTCSTTQELVQRTRVTLCDPEAAHWSDQELMMYLNEALCEIAGLRPDEFVSRVDLPLVPGACQEVPAGCIDLVSIEGQDCSGEGQGVTREASTSGTRLGDKFLCAGDTCPDGQPGDASLDPCAAWTAGSYRVVSSSRGFFMLDPPVPAGCDAITLTAMVYCPPERLSLGGDPTCVLPCMYDAQVVDFMLMRAFEKDTESTFAQQRSSYHRRAFYEGMNSDYRAASRLRSGYILGQDGHGNEQTGWRNEIRGIYG